jgi:hypothetical protein
MKNFIIQNWYKIMIESSLFMGSLSLMIHSVLPLKAGNDFEKISNYKIVPVNADGTISVKLSDEQLDKIIPKNEDGSINVKLTPNSTIDVNIEKIRGYYATFIEASGGRGLLVGNCTGTYKCD